MAFVEKYGFDGITFEANYIDTALTATYEFIGLGSNVPPVTVRFQSGTAPSYEGLADYVRQYGGENATIVSISPSQAPSQSFVIYTVECRVDGTRTLIPYALTRTAEARSGSKGIWRALPHAANGSDPRGLHLAGWYADKGCTKAFDFGAGMPGKDTTVYAKWNANTYTITFATSTGTAPGAREIKHGEPYGDLPVLTDSTLRFMGWFTQQTGGTQVTADTVFTGTGNQTLYAHWEQKSKFRIVGSPSRRGRKSMMNRNRASRRVHRQRADGDLSAEDFTVTYLWEKAGSEWTEDAPVNAGGYLVKLSRATDDKYLAFELTTDQAAVAINKLNLTLKRPVPTISNWIATVDVSGCGIKGDGTVTYIMKRVEADNAWEVGRNTTGTFDISSYSYGAGTYAFAVAVTGGTNYNDAQSTFGSYVVDDSGSGGSI
ncbi:MAG: InlB B-repeat-containing protein [Hydrogeniiclostridium mannosilyticum]